MAKIFNLENRFECNGTTFVWHPSKAVQNLRKHHVCFEDAATVFDDPFFILIDASRFGESREAVIGFDLTGRLLYVVHIEVEETCIQIISARRADHAEEARYAQ